MITPYPAASSVFDEVFDTQEQTRPLYQKLVNFFRENKDGNFEQLSKKVQSIFESEGITFAVYSEAMKATERTFPFDLIPRLIEKSEWKDIEAGVIQRGKSINAFLADLYGEQRILKEGIVPSNLITSSVNFLKEMKDYVPPGGIYNHISGTDIIRHNDGKYYVLEDNIRCPSGVSYVIANRRTLKRTFPKLFAAYKTEFVDNYSTKLLEMMQSVAPEYLEGKKPNCVLLTPGMYNSAYYEHTWLAQSMGISLVEGRDLVVENKFVYTNSINGKQRVDVIYRRIDDNFLDPLYFKKDSLLGVAGIMDAYRAGNVTVVNAPGTGVADDKAVYNYIPQIIDFYSDITGESKTPILNNVPTYLCEKDDDYNYVIQNIDKLVIKPVDESGGYGISIGNTLTDEQISKVQQTIKENRRKYIAQPILSLSTHPTFIEDEKITQPRHMDLRTFSLMGRDQTFVLPGGLTRVALKKGNLIVNSSQGGGSKDTWVVDNH